MYDIIPTCNYPLLGIFKMAIQHLFQEYARRKAQEVCRCWVAGIEWSQIAVPVSCSACWEQRGQRNKKWISVPPHSYCSSCRFWCSQSRRYKMASFSKLAHCTAKILWSHDLNEVDETIALLNPDPTLPPFEYLHISPTWICTEEPLNHTNTFIFQRYI